MKIRLKESMADGIPSLTSGKSYEVLGIEGDWFRLFNELAEPVLYDPDCFLVVDPTEPENWQSTIEDGVRYAYPGDWGVPGFFEDWHDRVSAVREKFWVELCHGIRRQLNCCPTSWTADQSRGLATVSFLPPNFRL